MPEEIIVNGYVEVARQVWGRIYPPESTMNGDPNHFKVELDEARLIIAVTDEQGRLMRGIDVDDLGRMNARLPYYPRQILDIAAYTLGVDNGIYPCLVDDKAALSDGHLAYYGWGCINGIPQVDYSKVVLYSIGVVYEGDDYYGV